MSESSRVFPQHYFRRYDESDDSQFYVYPRLTVHIDEGAIAATSQLMREELPPNGVFLDLMSSYRSHFPPGLPVQRLVGLGLNDDEMRNNPQLDEFVIHDVNREPRLPFEDGSFDGAVCTVSVQYMTRPLETFAEVGRVLRPGAPFIVTFSNRCFPSKAVSIWTATSDEQHLQLVQLYFTHSGCFTDIKAMDRSPKRWLGDPLFAVVGRRVV
ncbi:MAG: class I SAM-dependent methyltransferase [Chloroflexaceae bacterium]|nr:class I SAM-dependent methyltransferase [Chloroflexaceae bacterium]